MPKLTGPEIAAVAKSAGLTRDVDIAVAIALAESGGKTDSHNPVPPDDSYGLWQINMLGSMGPARLKQFGISQKSDLYDPATNARAMMQLSGGGKNWRPWTTYTRGTYKLYLGKAGASDDVSVTPISSTSSLSSLADKLQDGHFWARVSMYVLGFIIIVVGVVMIVGTGKARAVTNTIKAVAK